MQHNQHVENMQFFNEPIKGLKIPVSAVRFCPSAPVKSRGYDFGRNPLFFSDINGPGSDRESRGRYQKLLETDPI